MRRFMVVLDDVDCDLTDFTLELRETEITVITQGYMRPTEERIYRETLGDAKKLQWLALKSGTTMQSGKRHKFAGVLGANGFVRIVCNI